MSGLAWPGFSGPRRQKVPILALALLAWLVLWLMAKQHQGAGLSTLHHASPEWPDFAMMVAMWWCMALAMMLPTALPAVETLEELTETASRKDEQTGAVVFFVAGFLVLWFGFGLLAAILQWVLQQQHAHADRFSMQMNAALLLLAGAYQWTPWKDACVSRCRAPMTFFMMNWQGGDAGYWRMGNRMGRYCLGCCWAMMLLMFALGVMNLLWMGILTLYMYAEKNWIKVKWFDRATGTLMLLAGVVLLVLSRMN